MLLGGLAYCAHCGAAMTLRTGTSRAREVHRYYWCNRVARQGRFDCDGATVREEVLDKIVISALEERVLNASRLTSLLEEILKRRVERENSLMATIPERRERIRTDQRALDNLLLVAEDDEAISENAQLKARIQFLSRRLASQQKELEDCLAKAGNGAAEITPEKITLFTRRMRELVTSERRDVAKIYISQLLHRVEVSHDRQITIIGYRSALEPMVRTESDQLSAQEDSHFPEVRRTVRRWLTTQCGENQSGLLIPCKQGN